MKMLNNLKKLVSDKNVVFNWICAVLLIVYFAVQFMPYWTFTANVPVMEKQAIPAQIVQCTYNHLSQAESQRIDKEKKVAALQQAQAEFDENQSDEAKTKVEKAMEAVAKIEKAEADALAATPICVGCKAELDKQVIEEKIASLDPAILDEIKADIAAYELEPIGLNESLIDRAKENIKKLDQDKLYIKCENCNQEFMSVFDDEIRIIPADIEIGDFDEQRSVSVFDYVWFTYQHSAIENRKELISTKSGVEDYFNDEADKAGRETPVKANDIVVFPALFMALAIFAVIFAVVKPETIWPAFFSLISGFCAMVGFIIVPELRLGSLVVLNIVLGVIVFAFSVFALISRYKKKIK